MPRIPLIEELTKSSIPPGSTVLVEFAGASEWYNATLTIAARWLEQGGKFSYNTFANSPDDIRSHLSQMGVGVEDLEKEDKFRIFDYYTLTLGQKSKEKYSGGSLKVHDLSLQFSTVEMKKQAETDRIILGDNISSLARFNDERAVVELWLSRVLPSIKLRKARGITSLLKGIHSAWVYEQLEAAHDGVIDFKLDETRDPPRNLIRIRNLRNVKFDGSWHPVRIGDNFDVTLEK